MTGSSLTCQIENNLSISGWNSDLMPVDCGVLQRSVLGPLLFLIYIEGYLRYKTIFCHKVALDVQLTNFFM